MKKCLILINDISGRNASVSEDKLKKKFAEGYSVIVFHITPEHSFSYVETDRLVVCGGDGTLNRILNMYQGTETEIFYCPFGTLNETSKKGGGKTEFDIPECGKVDERYFSYVFATGTFTPLGYAVNVKLKHKIKALAYVINVFRQLKVWRVRASLCLDGTEQQGEYCLLMVLDSPQCFGLHFNKMFVIDNRKSYLLTVKSPRFNGFFGLAEMFFSFFRAFFIGFKKPFSNNKMQFVEFEKLHISLDKEYDFCVDGDCWKMSGDIDVSTVPLLPPVRVYTDLRTD